MSKISALAQHYDKIIAKHIYENSIELLYILNSKESKAEADASLKVIIDKILLHINTKYKQCLLTSKDDMLYAYSTIRENLTTSRSMFKSLASLRYN